MPAPKGNRNAAKVVKKSGAFGIRLSPEAMLILDNMVADKKIPRAQVIEKLIITEYQRKKTKESEN